MGDVERLAERIIMLHGGEVLVDNALDELQEEFSLALVPIDLGVTRSQLLKLIPCLAVRTRSRALHAVFQLDANAAKSLIESSLGITGVNCHSLPLEEMFIEVMGGQS
jgi:ABC-type uncharacterized transport system ATPase subunit